MHAPLRSPRAGGAQQLRSLAPGDLPVIFVSADPYENHPELLRSVGAQGFVNKPVIESELLDLLARSLQLEWVHEAHPAPVPKPDLQPSTMGMALLGDDLRQRIVAMARMGNASGLRQVMRSLEAYVDRFDFNALIGQIRVDIDD